MRPLRRTASALVLALLLVLSGCSFITGSPPTTSPISSPASPSLTSPATPPDLSADERPPGVRDGRLENASALLFAHTTSLVRTGFEWDLRVNGTTVFRGEVLNVTRRQRTTVEPGRTEYIYLTTNGGEAPHGRFLHWGNETVQVLRAQVGGNVRYSVGEPPKAATLAGSEVIGNYLRASTFTVRSVNDSGDTALVTLVATDLEGDSSKLIPTNATNVSNYRAVLVVDATGRIHEFDVSADYTIDGRDATFHIAYTLLGIDSPTVERPSWVDEVLGGQ